MLGQFLAVALLAQASPAPTPTPNPVPVHLRFRVPPDGQPDPTLWPGVGGRLPETPVNATGRPVFVALGLCAADGPCRITDGHFEHNEFVAAPAGTPELRHVDRYVLIGPAGRAEGYAFQVMQGPFRYFLFRDGTWREVKSGTVEYADQAALYNNLSRFLGR